MEFPHKNIYLIRHGETEWTLNGRHTGKTDILLTPRGEQDATLIGKRLQGRAFEAVFSSPLKRAYMTCQRAGFEKKARIDVNLSEWNYGKYEGLTSQQIWKESPHWNIFSNGAPLGESSADVSSRANRFLSKIQSIHGDVAVFSHGHFLRVLAARWLGLNAHEGRLFALFPSSVSILGFEKSAHVISLWNDVSHLSN